MPDQFTGQGGDSDGAATPVVGEFRELRCPVCRLDTVLASTLYTLPGDGMQVIVAGRVHRMRAFAVHRHGPALKHRCHEGGLMPYREDACPGPCNRRARQAWDDYEQAVARYAAAVDAWRVPLCRPVEPEPPRDDAFGGDPVWCRRDSRLIRGALGELDDLASLLAAVSDGHRGAGARHGKTGPAVKGTSAPTPGTAIPDTLDELYGALTKVEDDWREFRGYPARPARPRNSHARRLSITWLLDELDAILTHPGRCGSAGPPWRGSAASAP